MGQPRSRGGVPGRGEQQVSTPRPEPAHTWLVCLETSRIWERKEEVGGVVGGLARARPRGALSEAFLRSPPLWGLYSSLKGSQQKICVWRLGGKGDATPESRKMGGDCRREPQTGQEKDLGAGREKILRLNNQGFLNQCFMTGSGLFKGKG